MASSNDDADDSVDELQSVQASSPTKSTDVPSVAALQHRPRRNAPVDTNPETEKSARTESAGEDSAEDDRDELSFEIRIPPVLNREEYTTFSIESDDDIVDSVQSEVEGSEDIRYHVVYADGRDEVVSASYSIRTTSPRHAKSLTCLLPQIYTFPFNITHHLPNLQFAE
jgi:hypothetical protein